VELKVLRDGKAMQIAVQLGSFPTEEKRASTSTPGDHAEAVLDGVSVTNITRDVAGELKLDPNMKGVVVENVGQASAAAEAGLKEGDVIQQVNHRAVTNVGDFNQAVKSSAKDNPILLLVNRQGQTMFMAING
jgi:serine protease Do